MRARLLVILTCSVLACSGGEAPDASSSVDAGMDGARDADTDGGVDAAEAGLDGSSDVDLDAQVRLDADAGPDPGWERLPGFPNDCYVERATRPENVLAVHWEPCLDALPACEMAVLDWSILPLDRIYVLNGGNDAHGIFAWSLIRGREAIAVIVRDSSIALAWRTGPYADHSACSANSAASGDGVGVEAYSLTMDGVNHGFVSTVSWDRVAELGNDPWMEAGPLFPDGDSLGTPSTSATTFAGVLLSGNILAVEPPSSAAILGHGGLGPVVVGHSVLWNWGDPTGATGIHVSRIGGTEMELYRAPAGLSVLGVRADGTWITWRSFTTTSTGDTLWAAPYRETPPLDARPLWGDIGSGGYSGTIGDGMFAYGANDSATGLPAVRVVDLSDGSRRSVLLPRFPDGTEWSLLADPAWVTRDEVAFPAGRISPTGRLQTVLRIDLTSVPVEHLVVPDAGVDAGG